MASRTSGSAFGCSHGVLTSPPVLPGIHDEAGAEGAGLRPAHEQLGVGHRARRSRRRRDPMLNMPDRLIVSAHADVPAQHVPARGVVAGPRLRVALNARRTGARDRVDALVGTLPRLRLRGGARHQQRVQRPRSLDRDRVAEAVRGAEIVPDLVLVVVVPPGVDAVVEHLPRTIPAATTRCRPDS